METTHKPHDIFGANPLVEQALQIDDEVGRALYRVKDSELDNLRIKKLMSSYVDSGFHQDKLSINNAVFCDKGGFIEFEMKDYFMPSDGEFHLSSLMAHICLLHATIIYSHLDNNFTTKQCEVYARTINHEFIKPIRTNLISLSFEITSKMKKNDMQFYEGTFDFNEGSFLANGKWLIPLESSV